MKNLQKIERNIKYIENILASEKEKKFEELIKHYTALYPRLKQRPEQYQLLVQMLKLYVHIEYDLWTQLEILFKNEDKEKYRRLMSIALKVMQQWDRTMSKLGFTFTAQPYIPRAENKTYDPKAVVDLQDRVDKMIEKAKENIEKTSETETQPEPEEIPIYIRKKKKKETFNGEGN